MSGKRALVGVLVVVVTAAVTTGIVIIGSPTEERTRRLDARRVEDLQRLSRSVEVYHSRHKRVPETLEELSKEPGLASIPRDPLTGQAYGYRTFNARSYELCGTFDRETSGARSADFWSHGAGTQCFSLEIKDSPRLP
jgi:hypothetical protein